MSERTLRRKNNPATNRKLRPSLSSRRITPVSYRRSSSRHLKKSSSEPTLSTFGRDDKRNLIVGDALVDWPQTCTNVFESPAALSPGKFEGYTKDAKVVVNVTVEGCPGPIRTMIKLGANVEETIRLVIGKYSEEGRTPLLDNDAASKFQLHHSHFSLASLNKSDLIGDAGTRSFYLSRGNKNLSNNGRDTMTTSFTSDFILTRSEPSSPPDSSPRLYLPSLISQIISKMIRRSHKLWKIFGCLQCN